MNNQNVKRENLLTRAEACLWGGAVGDAMGKATEGYTPARITETYGHMIRSFVEPIQPMSQFVWRKAEITEDTRQTLAVAQAIIDLGDVQQLGIARYLLKCDPKGAGTSSRLFHFILGGDLGHVSTKGSGNGAATRIAPVGLVNSTSNLNKLVEDVVKATVMTHGGRAAVAGAAAVAAAVTAAVEGWPAGYVMIQALQAAKLAECYGYPDNIDSVAVKIQIGIDLAAQFSGRELWERLGRTIGWGFFANQAVPAALILACTLLNAKEAILTAVNHGGDADAVAGIAGALAAALNPPSLPRKWIQQVQTVNSLDLSQIAQKLLELRRDEKPSSDVHSMEIGG